MTQVWLGNNRRIFAAAMLVPAVVGTIGALLLVFGSAGWRILGGIIAALALVSIVALAWQWSRPRLAYRDGYLLVNLRWSGSVRVPIEVVEGFLLGQGPSQLGSRRRQLETATIVIRFAERADEWTRVDTDPLLGYWCGHYATIRGTFCEPISIDLVNRLNARLHEATQSRRKQSVS